MKDIKNQVLSLNVKIQHKWQDCKLHWDPDDYQGISQIAFSSDKIWKPDTSLMTADNPVLELSSGVVVLRYDGTVEWTTITTLKSYCPVDLLYYPFDIQRCQLKFVVWSYEGDQVYLALMDAPIDNSSVINREETMHGNSSTLYISVKIKY